MLMSSDANNIYMNFNAKAENVLLSVGYDKMSIEDKNGLLAIISNKQNVAFSDITPDYILKYHKDLKVTYLEQQRDAAIHAGFTSTDGHTYSTRPDDQTNMLGQMIKILRDNTITTVYWVQADTNVLAPYTVADWTKNVFDQAFNFKDEQMLKCNNYITDVLAAKDHDTLASIVWATDTTTNVSSSNTSSSSGAATPTTTVSVSATTTSASVASATPTIA